MLVPRPEIELRAIIAEQNIQSFVRTREFADNLRGAPVTVELDRTNSMVERFLALPDPGEVLPDIELNAAKSFVAMLEARPADLSSPGRVMLELSPKEAEWSAALLTAGVIALGRTGRTDEGLFDTLISVALGGASRDDLLTRFVLTGGRGIDGAEGIRLDDNEILDRLDDLLGQHPITELLEAGCMSELRAAAAGLAGSVAEATLPTIPNIAPVTGIIPNHGRPGAVVVLSGNGWPATQPTDVGVVFTSNKGTIDLRATVSSWSPSQITVIVPSGVGVGPVGFVSVPTDTRGNPAAGIIMAGAFEHCLGARGSAIVGHFANWSPPAALWISPGVQPGGVNLFTGGPQITAVQPLAVHEGDMVTITGHEFANGDWVNFEGISRPSGFMSDLSLTAVVPAVIGGKRTVQVRTPMPMDDGSNILSVQILPTLTSLSQGQAKVRDSVEANGSGFNHDTIVTLNGIPVTTIFINSNLVTFTVQLQNVPVGGQTVQVMVKNPDDELAGPLPLVVLPPPLSGWVDLHTHPMSHLAFGKKLLHGAPDGSIGPDGQPNGSIIPAGTRNGNLTDFRASNINEALGNCDSTHGGWGTNNSSGDYVRAVVISNFLDDHFAHKVSGNAHGDHQHEGVENNFLYWPHQTSKVHQQMWWEWLERAYKVGNMRVMVALAVNSELLAEIINGDAPKDDKNSADLQIDEITSFVGRHDFMEIAKTPADLRRIVGADKLAVILGIEVDNIGNFNKQGISKAIVKAEIQRLYKKGVRYVFPIHLVDNKFGGTAIYENLFNLANKYSTGSFFDVETGPVDYKLGVISGVGGDFLALQGIKAILDTMSGIPYPPAFNGDPTSPDFCPAPTLACWSTFRTIRDLFTLDPSYLIYSAIPGGHINTKGLTDLGKVAVKEMMRLGMLIDIDHMSEKSMDDTLKIAEHFSYPVNMGHNGIRGLQSSERGASIKTIERVAALGGVFGVGTADTDPQAFIISFDAVWSAMGTRPAVAIGTDANGMEPLPKASPGLDSASFYSSEFPKSTTGSRKWDYTTEGVAHYGLMADFMKDVKKRDLIVYNNLMKSAEYFAKMWEAAEAQSKTVL